MIEADVVVVGAGGSGLAAAWQAATLGRDVIVLEKNQAAGGSTSWSVGSVTATRTRHQRRAGIVDSPEDHFEDMNLVSGALAPRDNLVLRRLLVDATTETLEWLQSLGIVFVGPMPEPPHRCARMHVVVPSSASFAFHLTRHCRRLGVNIRLGEQATRLLQRDGRVVGVEARLGDGSAHEIHARRGVVLAAGDYSNGRELKARYASPDVADIEAVNVTATGDGQQLALELGATVLNGDIVRGPIMRFVPPERRSWLQRVAPVTPLARLIAWSYEHLPARIVRPFLLSYLTTALGPSPDLFAQGAVLVNREGRRFTDECAKPNPDVARQPGRAAWIVFDAAIAARFSTWPHFISTAPGVAYAYLADYRRNRPDLFHAAPTLAALASSVGVPAQALERTIEEYNESGRDGRTAIAAAPFYALGPARSYVVFTEGGLAVTERLEVVGADGRPISGLYAAGSNGQGGLLLEGHGHHLCWAFASGRIAGRNAATAEAVKP